MALIILIAISFCTATSLILVNKKIMNNYGFECPTFLTTYHFLCGAILLNSMVKLGYIQPDKKVPPMARWTTAAFGVGSIVFLNLNLKVNSIGFYQLSKLCNIPMMVAYKFFFKGMKTPGKSLAALGVLLTGMYLFTVNDVEFNIPGTIIALIAITSTTVFQSRQAFMQSEFSITGPQLNHLIAFPEFVIGIIASLIMETTGPKSIFNHEFQFKEVLLILLTGVFATYGNIIGFIMIGKTGPVTFQVIGHTKTILIFIFGLIMFPPKVAETPEQHQKKIIGLVVSMVGVILYTYFELQIKAEEKRLAAAKEAAKSIEDDEALAERPPEGVFSEAEEEANEQA